MAPFQFFHYKFNKFKQMKKKDRLMLSFPAQDSAAVKNMLAEQLCLIEISSLPFQQSFFDSFDWRLKQKNFVCLQKDGHLHLHDLADRPVAPPLPLDDDAPPRFPQELPASALRQQLADILEIRALLPQTKISGALTELELLEDEQVIARAKLIKFGPECLLELQAGKGSRKRFRKLVRRLEQLGEACPLPMLRQLEAALTGAGRSLAECEPAALPALEPDMDSRAAAKLVCRSLLEAMQRNQQGVIDNIDTEFLHDFRVAIRRTRSLLALMKDALEPDVRRRFQAEFRALGKVTGPARDLDVQLLTVEECQAQLPESLHDGLDRFFADLRAKRSQEQIKLTEGLTAPECQTLLADWQAYLEQEEEGSGSAVGQSAAKIIRKQFAKLLLDIENLDSASSDEDVHQVRIQGKKLRYALEFFRSLYPAKKMVRLIKDLKQLQDCLGHWNDLSVQENMLARYLSQIEPDAEGAAPLAAAVGGLLVASDSRRKQARAGLTAAFQEFTSRKNLHLWQQLFGAAPKK
jgi:CHAD domain-containing protein